MVTGVDADYLHTTSLQFWWDSTGVDLSSPS